jgi:hemerythrin superfamily protein
MNALSLLRNDHRRVDRLFGEHKQAVGNSRRQKALFDEIHRELDVHAQVEGQVFYPAMESGFMEPVREQMEEARAEHEEVKALLKQLAGLAPEDAGYALAFTKLTEGVRHHVAEEEGEMFPVAREVLGLPRLEELGREMAELKQQLGPSVTAAVASAAKAVKRVVRTPARSTRSRGRAATRARTAGRPRAPKARSGSTARRRPAK